jgi:hypothetical protein
MLMCGEALKVPEFIHLKVLRKLLFANNSEIRLKNVLGKQR